MSDRIKTLLLFNLCFIAYGQVQVTTQPSTVNTLMTTVSATTVTTTTSSVTSLPSRSETTTEQSPVRTASLTTPSNNLTTVTDETEASATTEVPTTAIVTSTTKTTPQTQVATAPLLGVWAQWSSWGICLGACESGIKMRKRTCPDSYCLGDDEQTVTCDIQGYCSFGGWSSWGPYEQYGPCDRPCGEGRMTAIRHRQCLSPKDGCPGDNYYYTEGSCNMDPCFVHGNWAEWREWSVGDCSGTCGYSSYPKYRVRSCTNPTPTGGGKRCDGPSQQHYNLVCRHDTPCDEDEISTTEAWPDRFDPSVYIIISILMGIPLLLGSYFMIGAFMRAFCPSVCKKFPPDDSPDTTGQRRRHSSFQRKNIRFDYEDPEEAKWNKEGIIMASDAMDMPHDELYGSPRPVNISNVHTTVL